jgi:hypothetical protein
VRCVPAERFRSCAFLQGSGRCRQARKHGPVIAQTRDQLRHRRWQRYQISTRASSRNVVTAARGSQSCPAMATAASMSQALIAARPSAQPGNHMRPSVALEANRIAMQRAARKFNTANLRVFGSVLRGADR